MIFGEDGWSEDGWSEDGWSEDDWSEDGWSEDGWSEDDFCFCLQVLLSSPQREDGWSKDAPNTRHNVKHYHIDDTETNVCSHDND